MEIMKSRSQEYLAGYKDCMDEWLRSEKWKYGIGYSRNKTINDMLTRLVQNASNPHDGWE